MSARVQKVGRGVCAEARCEQTKGFEEGIARESVGTVESGAGDLPDGIESGSSGDTVHHGGDHAAALVMGGRDDRDGSRTMSRPSSRHRVNGGEMLPG